MLCDRHSGYIRQFSNGLLISVEAAPVGGLFHLKPSSGSGCRRSTASAVGRVEISILLRRYRRIAGKPVPARRGGPTLVGMNVDISRSGVMHLCVAGRRTERDQNGQGQSRTHHICSDQPASIAYVILYVIGGPLRRNPQRFQDRSNRGDDAASRGSRTPY